jgi:F-type H+-transporting ATPase subunit b
MAVTHGSELVIDNAAENMSFAAPSEGEMHNTLEAHGAPHAGGQHVDPTALGMNATAWVALAMLVVIAIMIWKKVPAVIGAGLDKKIAQIRLQLEEASQLRAEAEALKTEYEARAKAAAADTEAMLAHAREEAENIVVQARADAATLVERRGRMAEDKIAAAERTALAEVRAKAAAAAAGAAATLIAQGHDAAADRPLIDRTIAGIGARLN